MVIQNLLGRNWVFFPLFCYISFTDLQLNLHSSAKNYVQRNVNTFKGRGINSSLNVHSELHYFIFKVKIFALLEQCAHCGMIHITDKIDISRTIIFLLWMQISLVKETFLLTGVNSNSKRHSVLLTCGRHLDTKL